MRNLDISEVMCNGTSLIVTELCDNVKLEKAGQEVHIPRVTLDCSKGQLGCTINTTTTISASTSVCNDRA